MTTAMSPASPASLDATEQRIELTEHFLALFFNLPFTGDVMEYTAKT